MDLDNMKAAWDGLNEKLANQQLVNEHLIKQITNEQSANRFNKILRTEFVCLVINWLLSVYFIVRIGLLDSLFLKTGVGVVVLITIVGTYLSYRLYHYIEKVNVQQGTVLESLNAMAVFKNYYYWYKKVAIFLAYVSLFFVMPLVVKVVHNANLYERLDVFGLPMAVGIVLGAILVVMMYKYIYEKNIDEVEELLEDLKDLES